MAKKETGKQAKGEWVSYPDGDYSFMTFRIEFTCSLNEIIEVQDFVQGYGELISTEVWREK